MSANRTTPLHLSSDEIAAALRLVVQPPSKRIAPAPFLPGALSLDRASDFPAILAHVQAQLATRDVRTYTPAAALGALYPREKEVSGSRYDINVSVADEVWLAALVIRLARNVEWPFPSVGMKDNARRPFVSFDQATAVASTANNVLSGAFNSNAYWALLRKTLSGADDSDSVVVATDIAEFHESVNHASLEALLLQACAADDDDAYAAATMRAVRTWAPRYEAGLPGMCAGAALLARIVLAAVDRTYRSIVAAHYPEPGGVGADTLTTLRYVDDVCIVACSKDDAIGALLAFEDAIYRVACLRTNPSKTVCRPASECDLREGQLLCRTMYENFDGEQAITSQKVVELHAAARTLQKKLRRRLESVFVRTKRIAGDDDDDDAYTAQLLRPDRRAFGLGSSIASKSDDDDDDDVCDATLFFGTIMQAAVARAALSGNSDLPDTAIAPCAPIVFQLYGMRVLSGYLRGTIYASLRLARTMSTFDQAVVIKKLLCTANMSSVICRVPEGVQKGIRHLVLVHLSRYWRADTLDALCDVFCEPSSTPVRVPTEPLFAEAFYVACTRLATTAEQARALALLRGHLDAMDIHPVLNSRTVDTLMDAIATLAATAAQRTTAEQSPRTPDQRKRTQAGDAEPGAAKVVHRAASPRRR